MTGKTRLKNIFAAVLSFSSIFIYTRLPAEITPSLSHSASNPYGLVFTFASDDLWRYLRTGLTYLESPKPLQPPEAVAPSYVHPDARGFGAYGFSPEAYQDVQRLYPFFREISWEQILGSVELYDLANQAFADWLLKNLQDHFPGSASEKEIFEVLHQAWNLGLRGYKNGRKVVASRQKRAQEFKDRL